MNMEAVSIPLCKNYSGLQIKYDHCKRSADRYINKLTCTNIYQIVLFTQRSTIRSILNQRWFHNYIHVVTRNPETKVMQLRFVIRFITWKVLIFSGLYIALNPKP